MLLLGGKRTNGWGPYLRHRRLRRVLPARRCVLPRAARPAERTAQLQLFSWVPVGGLQVDFGLLLDPLSATFTLLITGVGLLIHVYSLGYMAHDPRRRLFFAYLNLFVAAMLVLVLGDSYLALFLGWEGVGLASYLLISFWFYVPAYATAAKKAFIMNRVGDVGLLIAMFLMFATLGTTLVLRRLLRRPSCSPPARRPRSVCCCCSARAASRASSRCTPGCPTPWPARRRSRR